MEPNKVIELPTKGLRLEIYDSVIILRSDEDMRVLSSAVKNGGLCTSKNILNMSVRWMYYSPTPEKEIERYEEVFGVDDIVGMMTAADVKKAVVRHQEGVTVVATAGVSNAASPGEEVEIWHNGTINIIVVVENKLKDEALANSIITITEAKTQVFNMLDIRSVNSGMPATGTTTDCVAVASLGRGDEAIRYTSSGTDIGRTMGKLVFECVLDNIILNNGLSPKRSMIRRASERKIDVKVHLDLIADIVKGALPLEDLENIEDETVRCLYVSGLRIYDEYSDGKGADRASLIESLKILGKAISKRLGGPAAEEEYENIMNDDNVEAMAEEDAPLLLTLGLAIGNRHLE